MSGFRQGFTTVGNAIAAALAEGDAVGDFLDLMALGSRVAEGYIGNVIDLVAGGTQNAYAAKPGYYLLAVNFRWIVKTQSGTFSTAPVLSFGNNGARNNVVGSSTAPALAQLTGGLAVPWAGSSVAAQGGQSLIDLTTPIDVTITTPAGGSSPVLTARPYILGTLVAVGDI